MCTEGSQPSESLATRDLHVENKAISSPIQPALLEPSCVTGTMPGGSARVVPKDRKAPLLKPKLQGRGQMTNTKAITGSDTSARGQNRTLAQTSGGLHGQKRLYAEARRTQGSLQQAGRGSIAKS